MHSTKNDLIHAAQDIMAQLRRAVLGKDDVMMWVLAAILARGHILMEDIPGVGKTTMAVAFSKVLGLSYNRVQFTPDIMPSDVTGYSMPDPATGKMVYQPGAVLCNLFLADELNRATSRTQSALLEAMEEGQVTVDGISHKLPRPFCVIATQNPTGAAGTQLLPDSQMDRFTIRLSLGYPSKTDEIAMVRSRQGENPMLTLVQLLDAPRLAALQDTVAATYISDTVITYAVQLIAATRNHPHILRGASPRATLSVIEMAKAVAQLRGRDYVVPSDISEVFLQTVEHRILMKQNAQTEGITAADALRKLLSSIPAPALR